MVGIAIYEAPSLTPLKLLGAGRGKSKYPLSQIKRSKIEKCTEGKVTPTVN
jgi:hypothetical protein